MITLTMNETKKGHTMNKELNEDNRTIFVLITFLLIYLFIAIMLYFNLQNERKLTSFITCNKTKLYNFNIQTKSIVTDIETGKKYNIDECLKR